MKKLLPVFLIIGVIAASFAPVAAGQDDERLKTLFGRLNKTTSLEEARALESTIWEIWLEVTDPETRRTLQRGIVQMNSGNLKGALKSFAAVTESAPNFAEGWNKRATVYYLLADFDNSVKDIAKTLKLEPRHFGALSGLGLINIAVGRPEAAIKAYEQALAVHPHLVGVRASVKQLRQMLEGEKT